MSNNEIVDVLKKHLKMYPLMQEQDIYKLVHQSFFGPAHYISDVAWANKYIKTETEETDNKEPEILYIGGGYYRYQLMKDEQYLNTLCDAFIESANNIVENKDGFRELLMLAYRHIPDKEIKEKFKALINELANFDYPAISHSLIYRQNYHPHYRIVHEKYKDKIILPK